MALADKGRDRIIEVPRLPWHGVVIPAGFELSLSGVSDVRAGKDGEPDKLEPIAGCMWLVGLTTGTAGDWGRLLRFQDHDDRVKELAIPAARLHEDPAILAREVASLFERYQQLAAPLIATDRKSFKTRAAAAKQGSLS